MQQQQPPSLLSLGGLGSGVGPMSGYENDYEVRFQERRRARMESQRRPEPYNKVERALINVLKENINYIHINSRLD